MPDYMFSLIDRQLNEINNSAKSKTRKRNASSNPLSSYVTNLY